MKTDMKTNFFSLYSKAEEKAIKKEGTFAPSAHKFGNKRLYS